MGKKTFGKAVRKLKKSYVGAKEQVSGLLGIIKAGKQVVEVTDRNNFVYVRLRGNLSELIQAYNDAVSPVYNLPVLVERDRANPNRYRIVSRDVGRYTDWGSNTSHSAKHGNSHSFFLEGGGGGDIVWVYSKQFTPFLVYPSGSVGDMSVSIYGGVYTYTGSFHYAGNTGITSLAPVLPTGGFARMMLIYLEPLTGNFNLVTGSYMDIMITGTSEVMGYIPMLLDTADIPLAAIRLPSGTTTLGWDNIYDVRRLVQ